MSIPSRHRCVPLSESVEVLCHTMERTGVADKVMSNLVSRKLTDDLEMSPPSTSFSVSRLNGPPLKLNISNEKLKERCTKLELRSLIGVKSLSNCISNNTLRKINSAIKSKSVKFPSVSSYYSDRDAALSKYFSSTDELQFELHQKDDQSTDDKYLANVPMIYCNDINGLIKDWWPSDTSDTFPTLVIKCSVDYGQGFLKVSVQILNDERYSNSVSELLLVALVEAPETRKNLLTIFSIESFQNFFSDPDFSTILVADNKCLQLMLGISTGNSKYPCAFCTWKNGSGSPDDDVTLRTGMLHSQQLQKFNDECDRIPRKAKECYNSISPSILGETDSPNLYKCGIPILHVSLGIVQHLFNKIEEELSQPEKDDVGETLNRIGAHRSPYHGKAFEGRGVRSILENLDIFPTCFKRTGYYVALCRYKEVLEECGGVRRKHTFQNKIEEFQEAVRQAGIKPFLKIHLLDHVDLFLSIMDEICTFSNPGLGWTSEQAIESCHHHFSNTWDRYKKTPGNRKKALLSAVIDFNYTRFVTSFSE